jgi:hypothetical protein
MLSVTIIIFILDISKLETGQLLIVIVFLANLQQFFKFRSNDILLIFLFFGILYWIYLAAYYFLDVPYHIYIEYQTPYLTNMVVYLQFLFQRIILIGMDKNSFNRSNEIIKIRKNSVIFYSLILILIMMAIGGVYGKQTIINQAYSIDTDTSIWFEYCVPVIIVAFMYANTQSKRFLVLLFGLIFMIEPLLFGRRLPFIMVSLTIFNLYFSGKYKLKFIFLGALGAFVLLRYFGNTRNPVSGDVGFIPSLLSLSADGIMQNNQGGVVLCTVTYLGLIKEGIFDIWFSIKSFIGIFTSVFLPSSLNIEEAYVNFEALKHASIPGNGGFPSIYLYLWGGYIGVIVGALLFNYIIRNPKRSRIVALYGLFILSTFPRWYSYNMMIIIKVGFWFMLLVALTDTFNKYVKIKRS